MEAPCHMDVATGLDFSPLEEIAVFLEASGRYRVLRGAHKTFEIPPGIRAGVDILLDLETTGLDPLCDEIIEMDMLLSTYGPDGTVYAVGRRSAPSGSPPSPFRLWSWN